jgi:hypothetical protein
MPPEWLFSNKCRNYSIYFAWADWQQHDMMSTKNRNPLDYCEK